MKERPILFSAPMVHAIQAGTKTQTRRVCKLEVRAGMPEPEWRSLHKLCPYGQPGDRLWVRETWAKWGVDHQGGEGPSRAEEPIYRADGDPWDERDKWRPSIHMPRWASRITLEVTGVRVERLQDISEADAQAEGCTRNHNNYYWGGPHKAGGLKQMANAKQAYQDLWESINGPGSWDANPWVWVVEFKRVEGGAA